MTSYSVCCKNYSYGTNLSTNYPYANNVDMPTCSDSRIPGNTCFAFVRQESCVFYDPDTENFMEVSVSDTEDKMYKVRKRRVHSPADFKGLMNFSVYDQNDSLITVLSYPTDLILNFSSDSFKQEISEVIKQFHSDFVSNEDFSLVEKLQNQSHDSSDKADSYLLSIMS